MILSTDAFTEKMPGFIHAVNNKQFSDIKFIVGDKTIYAHRYVFMNLCVSVDGSEGSY
jgi:hypothetical protein